MDTTTGRWPVNRCHDGSDEVMAAFAAFPVYRMSRLLSLVARRFCRAAAER
jgi:hypothetical protein